MAEKRNSWLRDLLTIPLIVGLLIAAFTYGLPKILADSKELSYTVEMPLAYLDKSSIGNATVKVNEVSVPEVFAIKVRIWNSGNLPLKELPVRFDLTSQDKDFRVLSVNHNTQPAKEFGSIAEQGSEGQSKRFLYQLLNPKDEDTLIFLTTAKADLEVYSKAESLSVKAVAPNRETEFKWYHAAIGAMVASLLTSIVEVLFRAARRRWGRKNEDNASSDSK